MDILYTVFQVVEKIKKNFFLCFWRRQNELIFYPLAIFSKYEINFFPV